MTANAIKKAPSSGRFVAGNLSGAAAKNAAKLECLRGHALWGSNVNIFTDHAGYAHRECRKCKRFRRAGKITALDKWRADHERRVQRAAIDPDYFDMCPRGVRERALLIRKGWTA